MDDLRGKAKQIRRDTFEMCVKAKTGHIASAFSCVDILVALYYGGILKYDPKNPKWEDRDRFILSKGHAVTALYPILADLGFIDKRELEAFTQQDSRLGSHPSNNISGIEVTTGSLGHGLGVGVGMALAAKMDKKDYRVFVLMGDGELNEGSVWEAIMFAGHHWLDNLIMIVDYNSLQCSDWVGNVIDNIPLAQKLDSFNWDWRCINGHNMSDIKTHLNQWRHSPLAIIAETVKGKGLSFMENNPIWHTKFPNEQEIELARKELC